MNSAFTRFYYDESTGTKLEHLRSIYISPDNNIFCGLTNGLIQVNQQDNYFTVIDSTHLYHHIFSDSSGILYLCRDDGIFIYNSGKILPVNKFYKEFDNYKTFTVNSHLFLGDSVILLGTENDKGVLIWNYKNHSVHSLNTASQPALASDNVNNMYRDESGRIWILSDRITILNNKLTNSQTIDFNNHKLNSRLSLFFDMCEAGGYYWIASYSNGIIQADDKLNIKRILSMKQGLCNEGVYNIFSVKNTSLFITTNNGLAVYNISNHQFKNYYTEDGLNSNSFEEVASVNCRQKLYLGGINGFTIADPALLQTNIKAPLLYFSNIKIQTGKNAVIDTSNIQIEKIDIPNNWLQTTISFVGINYSNPERVSYQYRIKESDTNWVNNSAQNFISLVGVSPGTYHLEVKAANEDGYWSAPKTLTLIFEPKWYQTWWFYAAIALVTCGLLYAFYRYRVNMIKKQQKRLQKVREGIAGDLHDDIGGTLNSLKIFAHLAEESENKKEYFTQIQQSLKQASEGLRDMIWVLDDKQDTVEELANRLTFFAQPVASASGIKLEFILKNAETILTKTEKRNLLMIAKEAVNNCIKYAGCKEITITFEKNGNTKVFTIRDNGVGFSRDNIVPGNGLKNITTRAAQIKYNIDINSALKEGTTIKLTSKA